MEGWEWKQDYEALLDEGCASSEVEQRTPGSERRAKPRFRLKSQHVWIKVEPRFSVVDVSVSGISVYSDFPFAAGQTVHLTLGKAFSLEATVRDCTLVLADERLLETKYRVRCQFEDESVGMQCLVMMKQMDELEIAPLAAGG